MVVVQIIPQTDCNSQILVVIEVSLPLPWLKGARSAKFVDDAASPRLDAQRQNPQVPAIWDKSTPTPSHGRSQLVSIRLAVTTGQISTIPACGNMGMIRSRVIWRTTVRCGLGIS